MILSDKKILEEVKIPIKEESIEDKVEVEEIDEKINAVKDLESEVADKSSREIEEIVRPLSILPDRIQPARDIPERERVEKFQPQYRNDSDFWIP